MGLKAPIALFLYNRLEHTRKTVNALLACKESIKTDLFIFCDGPKTAATDTDIENISAVRDFAKKVKGFKSIKIVEYSSNIGLSNSIVRGINEVLNSYENIIVIEDDIIVSSDFLTYMNEAFHKYGQDNRVAGITGYSFPIHESDMYFTRTGSCWGWGTFKRVWFKFMEQRNSLSVSHIPENELKLFNVYEQLYTNMFECARNGIIQSWAVEFYLYYFIQKQYFLMPGINLINNVGFDGSGRHGGKGNFLTDTNPIGKIQELRFPSEVGEPIHIRKKLEKLYKQGYAQKGNWTYFFSRIKKLFLGQ